MNRRQFFSIFTAVLPTVTLLGVGKLFPTPVGQIKSKPQESRPCNCTYCMWGSEFKTRITREQIKEDLEWYIRQVR